MKLCKIAPVIIGVVILILLMSTCITIVNPGHVGVQVYLGDVQEEILDEGFHWKNPLTNIEQLSIRTREYTMSFATGEGVKTGDDSIWARSKDGLNIALDITILYKLQPNKASDVFQKIGRNYVDVIVRPYIRTVIREV